MRRRNRNRPALAPRAEILEIRPLMAPIAVSSTQSPAQFIFHSGDGVIDYQATGKPVALPDFSMVVEDDPGEAPGTAIASSGSLLVDDGTVIDVTPPAAPNGQIETVTFTITNVECCESTDPTLGSPASATLTFKPTSDTPTGQVAPFCSITGPVAGTASPGTGAVVRSALSGSGVQYGTGAVNPRSQPMLTSDGYGGDATGLDLGWTNLTGFDGPAAAEPFGQDMTSSDLPWIEQTPSGVSVVQSAGNALPFTLSGGTFIPSFFNQDSLVGGSSGYALFQTDGTRVDFYGFGSSIPVAQQGQFEDSIDAEGNVTSTTYNSTGQLTAETRADGGTTESYVYSYISGGINSGLVSNVALERSSGGGPLSIVRQVAFTYYDGTQSTGNAGELEENTLEDASGNSLGTTYFRYYTQAEINAGAVGYVGGLQYQLNPQSYARMVGAGYTPESATAAQLGPYADQYYQYDPQQRVTETIVQGAGCSCSGSTGEGTYTYAYTASTNPAGVNSWAVKTVETLPDGTQDIVYTNADGEVMLSAVDDVSDSVNSSLNGLVWATDYYYDAAGREVMAAQPSAVTITSLSTLNTAASANPDIVGYNASTGAYAYLSPNSGLIGLTNYDEGATTASTTSAGNVAGYLENDEIQQGYSGTPILRYGIQYIANTAGSSTEYFPATTTVYRNTNGTGAETTSTAYTWYSGTNEVRSTTVSAPLISIAEDGPGGTANDVTTTDYDTDGRPTWTKDGDGFIDYTAYDDATGAVVESIVDVNTSMTGEFTNLPSGWSTPYGGGLNLVTKYAVDGLGRTTEETSPAGNVTYTVYEDPAHEVRVYPGWNATTGTTTGPIQVTREDWAGSYDETLTLAEAPTKSGSAGSYVPTGAETISANYLRTLSRTYLDKGGRDVEDDAYFNFAGLTYSTTPYIGAPQSSVNSSFPANAGDSTTAASASGNYYATTYGFDEMGRPSVVDDANGTITITEYDSVGRPTFVYVGTNDSGFWTGGSSNMVEVEQKVYDGNGVGDGDLTQDTDFLHSSAAPDRESQYVYDWRDRLIASKSGVQSSEDTVTHRPIVFYTLDNLGEVVEIQSYDGDGITLGATAPSSTLLREQVVTAYDDQGRPYEQQQYEVSQQAVGSTPAGTVSTYALTTYTYYDHRGDTIAVYAPGGLVTKDFYDGAGRLVEEAQTDGAGGTTWFDASSLFYDDVLTETLTTYDADGNPTLVATEDRFGTDSTDTGPLVVSDGNSSDARVYYTASYYDAADRLVAAVDVGTNGGSAYTPPASVPPSSDTVLVTGYTYNDAGWVATVTDPRGIATATAYDALGRPVQVVDDSVMGPVNTYSNQTTDYTYDGMGHTLTVTAVEPSGTPNQVTTYNYGVTTSGSATDDNDELYQVIQPGGTEVDTYAYDAAGDLATTAHGDANGNIHTYFYDTLGRVTADAVSALGASVDGSVRMILTQYNDLGLVALTTSTDSTGGGNIVNQVEDLYDGLGRLTGEYQSTSGAVVTTGGNPTPEVQYSYSEMSGGQDNDRLIGMTYPNGRVLDFAYTGSSIDGNISRVDAITDGSGNVLESYGYLGLDTIVSWNRPQVGVDLTYLLPAGEGGNSDAGDQYTGLDRFGRVIDQNWLITGGGQTISNVRYQYAYDRDGDVLYRNDLVLSGLSELYHASGGADSAAYDGLGRLTSFSRGGLSASGANGTTLDRISSPNGTQSWSYDALGNQVSVTTNGSTVSKGYNANNQETSASSGSVPTYDPDGNTITNAGDTYVYDAWNRLVEVYVTGSSPTNVVARYTYDGLGRRVTEANHAGTVDNLYYDSGWHVIEERSGGTAATNVTYQYVIGASGQVVLRDSYSAGSLVANSRLYPEWDANGDITAIVGYVSSGGSGSWQVVERYMYSPYGTVTVLAAATGIPVAGNASAYAWQYLFQGGRQEAGTGMYIFEHRDYNPTSGIWMERDPLGLTVYDTNLYLFVNNNPVSFVDDTGFARHPWGKVGEAIGGVWSVGPIDAWNAGGWVAAEAGKYASTHFPTTDAIKKKGGCCDPFNAALHVFWQALLTLMHGEDGAEGIGNSHEFGSQDAADSWKDQYNNVIGRNIGMEIAKEYGYLYDTPYKNDPDSATFKMMEAFILSAIYRDMRNGKIITCLSDKRLPEDLRGHCPSDCSYIPPIGHPASN